MRFLRMHKMRMPRRGMSPSRHNQHVDSSSVLGHRVDTCAIFEAGSLIVSLRALQGRALLNMPAGTGPHYGRQDSFAISSSNASGCDISPQALLVYGRPSPNPPLRLGPGSTSVTRAALSTRDAAEMPRPPSLTCALPTSGHAARRWRH